MKNILAYMGILLEIFAVFLILPVIVGLIYNEPVTIFFIPMVISLFLGIILDKSFTRDRLSLNEGLMLTAITFLVFSFIGSIPYYSIFTGNPATIALDTFFEGISGFTTTGLTVIEDLATVPKSILFWRSETQWLGGIGIIVIFLSILSRLRTSSTALYEAQGYTEKLEPTIYETSRRMMKIYFTYSALGIFLLYLSGLDPFEAVTTTFTSISTGGFTVNDSIFPRATDSTLAIISILMLIGSVNFMIHDKIFKMRPKEALKNIEVQSMAIMILIASLSIYILTGTAKIAIFETISALTATGFTITEISLLSTPVILILTILMYIGSSSGSTAGGIKQMRFLISLKTIPWTIRKMTLPSSAIIPFKIRGNPIDENTIRLTGTVIFTYTLSLAIGTMILIFAGYTPIESFFQVTSAQGTVGLDIIGIASASAITKMTLIANMLLGRLEIFPILILISNIFSRR
ncbi:MAG: TrkH family potassium uptake protein [archaeon]